VAGGGSQAGVAEFEPVTVRLHPAKPGGVPGRPPGTYPTTTSSTWTARFDDDLGFCPECEVPYCHQHWHRSDTGYGFCPYEHGKDLDPHWAPLTASHR
jgi:hypothetical protein